jgi:hypothetical protein
MKGGRRSLPRVGIAAFATQQPRRSPPTYRLADRENASPFTHIIILAAQSTLAADLACGPPTAKSHSKRAGTASHVPSRGIVPWRFSDAGRVREGMFVVTAGV